MELFSYNLFDTYTLVLFTAKLELLTYLGIAQAILLLAI